MDLVAQGEQILARFNILTRIPEISNITPSSMLIEMPELGSMTGKQAACLAGLAPISKQSGRWQAKERSQGGQHSSGERCTRPRFAPYVINSV